MTDFQYIAKTLAAFDAMPDDTLLRGRDAGLYSKLKYGRGSERSLAKLRCLGGGPEFRRLGPAVVVYTKKSIDDWNKAKISAPMASTSEAA